MASLEVNQLKKRNNFGLLLKKIQTGQPFELTPKKKLELGKETVVLKATSDLLTRLDEVCKNPNKSVHEALGPYIEFQGPLKCFMLETTGKEKISSGYLQKTWEFGGKTSEMVYRKETQERKNIQAALRKTTVFGLKPITVVIKTSTNKLHRFENVFTMRAPEPNGNMGKMDFEFLDKEGNVLFNVSHKSGCAPKHFRQWSGLRDFKDHPEVQQFGIDLQAHLLSQNPLKVFPLALSVGKEIKDENLKKLAIFGNKEVDFLIQGECEFIKQNDFEFTLTAPLVLAREEGLGGLPKGYEPVLLARRGDLRRGTFGIKGCRGMIYPRSGRKIHLFL